MKHEHIPTQKPIPMTSQPEVYIIRSYSTLQTDRGEINKGEWKIVDRPELQYWLNHAFMARCSIDVYVARRLLQLYNKNWWHPVLPPCDADGLIRF